MSNPSPIIPSVLVVPFTTLDQSWGTRNIADPGIGVCLKEGASLPSRGSEGAAGYDLSAFEDGIIPSGERKLIKTGVFIALVPGMYGRIAPRSGLAHNFGIDVFAGVIDSDYRGEIGVILFNSGEEDFKYSKGDRIAQLILTPIVLPTLYQVDSPDDTKRGEGGFGSTGT